MTWFRRGIVGLLSLVLLVALVGGALSTSSNIAFTHPDKIETWLDQSHFYDHFITNALDQAQKSANADSGAGKVSLSDPSVKQAAQTAFSPQLMKQDVNTVLNSNYAWLQGKTSTPSFNIDLTSVQQSFADQVGKDVQSRLAGLPVCTKAQLQQLAATSQNAQDIDPFNLPCLPPGVNPQTEATQVTQEVASNSKFLGDKTTITASSINPNSTAQSKPYYQKLSVAPTLYRYSVALPWIYALVAVLSACGIVFLAATKRRGFRRVGIVLFGAGLILVIIKFLGDKGLPRVEHKVFNNANVGPLQQSLTDFLHRVESQLVKIDLLFGIAYLVIALAILAYLMATRKRTPQAAPAKASPPAASTPQQPVPPVRPTRPKPPRLIQ